jgi:SAM-dependent methyltransferase
MERELFPWMARVEEKHWWFASRRAIVESFIERLDLPCGAAILEPGCGTGGNFAMLSRHGRVFAMDSDEDALRYAGASNHARLARGKLPDGIPFDGAKFDLVLMSDVLEHLDDDSAPLRALGSRLKPTGWLIATVPAIRWLWSGHDRAHHHRRRYNARALRAVFEKTGYKVIYLGYFNFILFPMIAVARILGRLRQGDSSGDASNYTTIPPAAINALLRRVFSFERHLLEFTRLPFGVSLLIVAQPSAASANDFSPSDRAH